MLRLHTFGTVHVTRDGHPMTGAAGQRRVLALLAVLASSGPPGISRDKLLALLWPEGDPERARHALTQALYNTRRALGCDDLVLVGADLRLNPVRMTSDVTDFLAAHEQRDFSRIAVLYHAPFLDGFHAGHSAELEDWVMAQRSRLGTIAASAFDALANERTAAGDLHGAAQWRSRRVDCDPLDSAAVLRLLAALAAAGDHGAAIRCAQAYERRMWQELELPPHQEVRAFVARLRAGEEGPSSPSGEREAPARERDTLETPKAFEAAIAPGGFLPHPSPSDAFDAGTAGDGLSPERVETYTSAVPRRPWSSRRWWMAGAGVVAAGVFGGAMWFRGGEVRRAPAATVPLPLPTEVVVAPFRVAGADPSLRYLGEGMVELLSVRLADDSVARAKDPGAILAAWRRAGLVDAVDVPRNEVLELARRLGARGVVTGHIIGGARNLVLSASLVSVTTGETLFSEHVEGATDSLSVLVDQLATRLLASDAGVTERLALHRLPPLGAVRAFLSGQAAYRRERYREAIGEFERALAIDSTFALAALRLALSADKLNGAEQHERALDLAWRFRGSLSAPDEAHLIAFAGPRYPSPSPEAEQLAAWDRAATVAPDRSEVWQELGEHYFHSGAVLGSVDWRARASAALRRALELDPAADGARKLLLLVAARGDDTVALREAVASGVLDDSTRAREAVVTWRVGHSLQDERRLEQIRLHMPSLRPDDLRWIAASSLFDAIAPEDGERALRILRARTTRATELLDVLLAQHGFALNQGRAVLALDLTEQIEQLQPATRAHLRLRVLDALYGDGDRDAAARAAALLERESRVLPGGSPGTRAARLANLCVLEQWRLAQRNRRTVRQSIAILRNSASDRVSLPVSTPPLACAELLEATAAVASRSARALGHVQQLDALMLTGPAIGDAANYAPIAIARLYRELGADRQALAAVRRRQYMRGWPRYLATARREEGRLAEQLGERADALQAYRRYLALRRPESRGAAPGDAAIRDFVRTALGE